MNRTQLLMLLLFLAAPARAQPPPDMPVTAEEKTRIILRTADVIDRYYIEPATGKAIAEALRASLESGPIARAGTALALVPLVNRLLRDHGGDRHLRFGYQHQPQVDLGDAPETPAQRAERGLEAAQDGFGVHGVQWLEGNIALLTLQKFYEPDVAGDAVAAAMALLQPSDALIIDLRDNAGGSPYMVSMLVSYFLAPTEEPLLLSTVENRYKGDTLQFWSAPYLPGPRYEAKHIYILSSRRTFSAGEGFIEQMRRIRTGVTVLGDTTRGGARMSRWITVDPHFAVSVSVARHMGDTKDWEGVGLAPDVVTPEKDALRAAHLMALRALRTAAADSSRRSSLDATIKDLEQATPAR
jgi:hypothetical protein